MADSIQCLCQIANAFNDKKRKFLIFFRMDLSTTNYMLYTLLVTTELRAETLLITLKAVCE